MKTRFPSFPFNHLTLAEAAEHERLTVKAASVFLSRDEQRRLTELGDRRHPPIRNIAQEGAA